MFTCAADKPKKATRKGMSIEVEKADSVQRIGNLYHIKKKNFVATKEHKRV